MKNKYNCLFPRNYNSIYKKLLITKKYIEKFGFDKLKQGTIYQEIKIGQLNSNIIRKYNKSEKKSLFVDFIDFIGLPRNYLESKKGFLSDKGHKKIKISEDKYININLGLIEKTKEYIKKFGYENLIYLTEYKNIKIGVTRSHYRKIYKESSILQKNKIINIFNELGLPKNYIDNEAGINVYNIYSKINLIKKYLEKFNKYPKEDINFRYQGSRISSFIFKIQKKYELASFNSAVDFIINNEKALTENIPPNCLLNLKQKNIRTKRYDSQQQKIWDYFFKNRVSSNNSISINLNISLNSIKLYTKALNNAGYTIRCISGGRYKNENLFKLIKYTGEKAPLYHNGILKDINIKNEFIVGKETRKSKSFNSQINLINLLDAILKNNKEEILISEISKIFLLNKNVKTKFGSSFLTRWIKKLEQKDYLIYTNKKYRNSNIYNVDLEKIKQLKEKISKFKDFNLAF